MKFKEIAEAASQVGRPKSINVPKGRVIAVAAKNNKLRCVNSSYQREIINSNAITCRKDVTGGHVYS